MKYLFILLLFISTISFSQVRVDQDGKVFANIEDAANYISTLATSTNPYRIDLDSDTLWENPFTLPPFTKMFAGNAIINANDNNLPFIIISRNWVS